MGAPMSHISDVNFEVGGGLPPDAHWFAWSYAFEADWHASGVLAWDSIDSDIAFLCNGGFVYWDKDFNVVRMDSVVNHVNGPARFGPPRDIAEEWHQKVVGMQRARPITNRE